MRNSSPLITSSSEVDWTLRSVFAECGFSIFASKDVDTHPEKVTNESKYILTNVPYNSIYKGRTSKSNYLIAAGNRHIRVEVKFQSNSGSVDEKYPYMLLNAIYSYPENEIILVVDGGGYNPHALQWLQDQIDQNWLGYKEMGKTILLMDIREFLEWFRNSFS